MRLKLIPLVLAFPFQSIANWNQDMSLKSQFSTQGFFETVEGTENSYSIIELQPLLKFKKDSYLKIQIEPYFYHKEKTAKQTERNFLDLQQGFIELQKSRFRIRLGPQIYNWGSMDFYSPMDVVNTQTLFDPISPVKLGANGIDLSWIHSDITFQWLFLPNRRASPFPETRSRWLPRDIIINPSGLNADLELPETLNYKYGEPIEINQSLENNWGAKISKTFNNLDWSLIYFEGVSQRPHVEIEVDIQTSIIDPITNQPLRFIVEPDVKLSPVYFKQRVFGSNLVWAPEWGILKFEGVLSESISDNILVDENLYQMAFSFEKNYSIFKKNLFHQFQYYKAWEDNSFTNTTGSNYRLFDNTIANHFLYSQNEHTNILASIVLDIEYESQIYILGLRQKLSDFWSFEIKYLNIQGSEESLGGTYKNNDLIELRLISYL